MSVKLKVGTAIIVAYLFLAAVSPILVNQNDIRNWHYITYWEKNPRMAPPEWVNLFGENLPPTGNLREEKPGEYVYNFHYSQPPQDILIIPQSNWSGFVDVRVLTPDGKRVTLYSGRVTGITSTGRSFSTVFNLAKQMGVKGDISDMIVTGEGLKILFFRKEGGKWVPVKGDYLFTVRASSKVTLRVVGMSYGPLGTDSYGRDIAVIFIGGLPQTLVIVFMTALTTVLLGTAAGLFGALSGKLGVLVEGFAKVSSMLPLIPVMILLVPILGGVSYYGEIKIPLWPVVLALSLLLFGKVSQNVRTITMTELSKEHILASKAAGASDAWVLRRHVLRAVLPYVSSQFILISAKVIALISILGFFRVSFGFNWGELFTMVVTQKAIYNNAWWMVLPVGMAITLLAIGLLLVKSEIEERFINPWKSL
ncbi:ABC transporter permease [Thermococcus henrietii]|uniref:ABC transporter permease n=1 Tax=Thermococcus henrietii TaxID=2016361 RepID=UPI000C07C8D6|nr:ABC transporter permease subunit [Thermococcus henrietii]